MDPVFDGRVFRRHAERVPADRMQDVKALHTFIARHDIADGVVAYMPHMDFSRRVGKHLQQVVFLFRRVFSYLEGFFLFPFFLPFLFDGRRIVFHNSGMLQKELNNRGLSSILAW